MTSSAAETTRPHVLALDAHDNSPSFALADGRTTPIPPSWYRRLAEATRAERNNWQPIGRGESVHRPDADEDMSVDAAVGGRPSAEGPGSLQRWRSARRSHHG